MIEIQIEEVRMILIITKFLKVILPEVTLIKGINLKLPLEMCK